jgi:hypothetical protein
VCGAAPTIQQASLTQHKRSSADRGDVGARLVRLGEPADSRLLYKGHILCMSIQTHTGYQHNIAFTNLLEWPYLRDCETLRTHELRLTCTEDDLVGRAHASGGVKCLQWTSKVQQIQVRQQQEYNSLWRGLVR